MVKKKNFKTISDMHTKARILQLLYSVCSCLNLTRLSPQVGVSGLLNSHHTLIMAQVLHMDPSFPGAASIYFYNRCSSTYQVTLG